MVILIVSLVFLVFSELLKANAENKCVLVYAANLIQFFKPILLTHIVAIALKILLTAMCHYLKKILAFNFIHVLRQQHNAIA